MKYSDAFEIIRKSNTNKFNVKIGSVTYKKRFFISNNKFCEFAKNSRRYGRYMAEYEVEEWDSITPCIQVKDVVKVRKLKKSVR